MGGWHLRPGGFSSSECFEETYRLGESQGLAAGLHFSIQAHPSTTEGHVNTCRLIETGSDTQYRPVIRSTPSTYTLQVSILWFIRNSQKTLQHITCHMCVCIIQHILLYTQIIHIHIYICICIYIYVEACKLIQYVGLDSVMNYEK